MKSDGLKFFDNVKELFFKQVSTSISLKTSCTLECLGDPELGISETWNHLYMKMLRHKQTEYHL
jgi:hypothetical protein